MEINCQCHGNPNSEGEIENFMPPKVLHFWRITVWKDNAVQFMNDSVMNKAKG